MAYSSEIEKLERRHRENPKGRNFAPLADAYRKAGEVDRAIEMCQTGLLQHPDYVSAHIVHGRCLIDKHDDAAAEQVFRKVLSLDPENILGLRILAEIAERGNHPEHAVEWLTRLLAADPMNGDAAEALARARGRKAALAKESGAAADPVRTGPRPGIRVTPRTGLAALAEATTLPMAKPEIVVEQAAEPPPMAATAPLSGEIEPFDGTIDFNTVAHEAAKANGLEVEESPGLEPEALVVDGLAPTQYESAFPTADGEAIAGLEEMPTIHTADSIVDLPLILPEDVEASAAVPPPRPRASGAAAPRASDRRSSPHPGVLATLSDDDGAADRAALAQAETVLTETMAEVYLRQGHPEEARRIYEALVFLRPGDTGLRERMTRLIGGGDAAAAVRTGVSARDFLRSVLHGGGGAGLPARPARDAISLESVFEADAPPSPAGGAAVVSSALGGVGAPTGPSTGGFSFDDFFAATGIGGSGAGAGGAEAGAVGAGAGAGAAVAGGSGRAGRAGGAYGPPARPEGEERADLDEFQRWLHGLKT